MNIEQDRKEDLTKLAVHAAEAIDGQEARDFQKPELICALSRVALGIEPARDIDDLHSQTRTELLFVMRTVRDITFGAED